MTWKINGEKLSEFMRESNIQKLKDKVSQGQTSLYRLKKGQRPIESVKLLLSLANTIGFNPKDLFIEE